MEVCPCMVSCCKQILYSFKKNCPNGCPCPEHDCDYYTTTPFPTEPITGGTRPTFLPWINSLKDETFSKHWDRIFFRVSTVTRYFDPRTSSSLFSPLSCLVSQSPSKTKMLLLILLVSVQANVQKEKIVLRLYLKGTFEHKKASDWSLSSTCGNLGTLCDYLSCDNNFSVNCQKRSDFVFH